MNRREPSYAWVLAILLMLSGLLWVESVRAIVNAISPVAECTTDSECMRLCPPADAECDGGPGDQQ